MSISNLRLAEELVEQGLAAGTDQYLLLGAGLDSFGVRRSDLADRLRVFELDHPVPQGVKRDRILRARGSIHSHSLCDSACEEESFWVDTLVVKR